MDVKPLYINIPKHEGIEAVKEKLNTQTDKPIATKAINKIALSNINSN